MKENVKELTRRAVDDLRRPYPKVPAVSRAQPSPRTNLRHVSRGTHTDLNPDRG